ncbi:MAG: hypothetical protein NC338_05885 [Firmicutes bacterium]|nr:hypothetical protein [Bacillota bacterium]MCM1400504.1 hypothetical protein [Bacteroides sp.]MCM1476868.1 hypothetical protein [Bacteroides sp.]
MFSEAIKPIAITSFALAMLLGVTACSDGNSAAETAGALLEQAQTLKVQGQYEQALLLLDSIDHAYAAAVDVRRRAMHLRPQLLEQVTNRQLELADSLAAVDAWRLDSLQSLLTMVSNPIEHYYVPRAEGHADVSSAAGLHARMAPDGRFYLIATSPRHLGTTSVTVSCGGSSATSPAVAPDGERNDHSGATDVITFVEAECDAIGRLVAENPSQPVSVTFNGSRSSATMTLPEAQARGLANIYATADLIRRRKTQELEKQRLERTLQAVRSQIARTTPDDSTATTH